MLLEFSVENFKSIKERTYLSMIGSKDNSHENNLIRYEEKKLKALKTAVIYGANGSGKSNVLKALDFFTFFLLKSERMQKGAVIEVEPFKLDKEWRHKPTSFEIVFMVEKIKYAYGFSVNEEKVLEEYLYYYPKGRQSIIFERENTNEYKFTSDVEKQTQIKEKFHSDNKLFISTLSIWEYEKAQIPFIWLINNIEVLIRHNNMQSKTIELMQKDEKINKKVKLFLKNAINDIEDVQLNEIKIDSPEHPIFNLLNDDIKAKLLANGGKKIITVNTMHKVNGSDELIPFDLSDESDGTQKLFGFLGYWIKALEDGSILVVDELDIRLHSHLTKFLVELFQNPKININNAQLIFSTHDTNLLDQDIFRRDQIWFTEKKDDNSTDLYSLDDFAVRKDAVIEKGYLQGKYGAIPYINGEFLWSQKE